MLTIAVALAAQSAGPAAPVWMAPPSANGGRCWRELFDQPEQWKETRALLRGLLYADHQLNRQFTDDELRKQFEAIKEWKLDLMLEVGAVKEWGKTGPGTFAQQKPMWERFQRLGARIDAIALDEPLVCVRHYMKQTDAFALDETVAFITLVRRAFPDVRIGDIETYPSIPIVDHLWWIDSLQKRLAAAGVRGLDFYRLDVNWAEFTVFNRGGWPEVRKLELECRKRKLPFSLIYWASDYPALQPKGLSDDSTWYVGVMRQGYDYALVDGQPDEFVVESWVDGPKRSLPETGEFTFTRSVRDFARRFVKPGPPAP